MRLQLFKYPIDNSSLIAQRPFGSKKDAKLMVVHRNTGEIEHKKFSQIVDYFDEGDIIVANDSYMMNNVVDGFKNDKDGLTPVKVRFLREVNVRKRNEIDEKGDVFEYFWDAVVSVSRKIRIGNVISFPTMNLEAEVVDNSSISGRILKFSTYIKEDEFLKILKDNASVYLPDYINREPEENDKIWTKSIYAKNFGSVTNIISGLHFYDDLLLNLKLKGVFFETLNYTINNFYSNRFESKTVFDCNKAIDICKMDLNLIYKINEAKEKAKKICAVGYSTALGLENRYSSSLGRLCDDNFFSNIVTKVILSNKDFYVCDAILTNFHEEGSMFLVVDVAFAGMDLLQKAYKSAFDNEYKFCMYGDSLLII